RADPVSSYYQVRLLMYAQPEDSRAVFERLLKLDPQFVWPHLEFVEWTTMPGRRRADDATPHLKAFQTGCRDALVVGVRGMDQDAALMRRALERRNTWLDLDAVAAPLEGGRACPDRAGHPPHARAR